MTPPACAAVIFGDQLGTAVRYADLLSSEGVTRGLVGPHEAARIWTRHILNCAVIGEAIPQGARVIDVGSGAGLPGIPLALARPDLRVELVEPLARRAEWLSVVVVALDLSHRTTVTVARAAAVASPPAGAVVSRAVAPLDRLLPWCAPLAATGGLVIAIKGETATTELDGVADSLSEWGLTDPRVARFGDRLLDQSTLAVVARRTSEPVLAGAVSKRARYTTKRRTS